MLLSRRNTRRMNHGSRVGRRGVAGGRYRDARVATFFPLANAARERIVDGPAATKKKREALRITANCFVFHGFFSPAIKPLQFSTAELLPFFRDTRPTIYIEGKLFAAVFFADVGCLSLFTLNASAITHPARLLFRGRRYRS